jgi:hypothetical protein
MIFAQCQAVRIRACPYDESVKNHSQEVLGGVYPTGAAHGR